MSVGLDDVVDVDVAPAAGDLVDELTREMNKERQSSITLELMDIIGGAEAVA